MFSSLGEGLRRGVEDTGFGTEMMGEERERPYSWSLSSLVEALFAASSFGSSSLLYSLVLLPSFTYLCLISISPSAVSIAASPSLQQLLSSFSLVSVLAS